MADEKVADPGPLGLAAFALTTFCLSTANAGLWKGAGVSAALSLAFFYGGLAQLLAGMWEFVRKNTFAAVGFTSFGAFWRSVYALVNWQKALLTPTNTAGIFFLGWAIFTFYMMIASMKVNMAVFVVFLLLFVTLVILTIGNWNSFGAHANVVKVAGWTGIATAAAAWYASAAGVINGTWGKVLLPVGPAK